MTKFSQALEQAAYDEGLRREPAAAPVAKPAEATAKVAATPPAEATAKVAATPPAEVVAKIDVALPAPVDTSEELDEHLVSLLAPTSFEADQYRALRHLIEQRHKATELSVVAVSSPAAGDGKTTTAINLAGALAQSRDARVLLVDADLRAANLATRLGLAHLPGPGLVETILDPRLSLEKVVHTRQHLNLSVLTAGRIPAAPYEVLKSPRLAELLAEARLRYDYIVIDTPPLVSVPDCRVIGKLVDGFLIVVTAHRTPRKLLQEALKVTEPAKLMGLVFNGDDRHVSRNAYTSKRASSWNSRRHSVSDD